MEKTKHDQASSIRNQRTQCHGYVILKKTMQQESEFKTKRCNGVQEKKTLTLAAAEIKCNHCQRVCKSSQGLKLHIKACKERLSRNISRENHVNYCKLKITSVRKGNEEDIAKQHEITEGIQKMIPSQFS